MAGHKLQWLPGSAVIQSSQGALKDDTQYPVVLVSETHRKGKDDVERDEIQVGIIADNGRLWMVYPSKGVLSVIK
jgi:hypothetical protein